jgi:hypothetical protein
MPTELDLYRPNYTIIRACKIGSMMLIAEIHRAGAVYHISTIDLSTGMRCNDQELYTPGDMDTAFELACSNLLGTDVPSAPSHKDNSILKVPIIKEETCPLCETGVLVQRKGKFGGFWGCSEWPKTKCPYILKGDGTPTAKSRDLLREKANKSTHSAAGTSSSVSRLDNIDLD